MFWRKLLRLLVTRWTFVLFSQFSKQKVLKQKKSFSFQCYLCFVSGFGTQRKFTFNCAVNVGWIQFIWKIRSMRFFSLFSKYSMRKTWGWLIRCYWNFGWCRYWLMLCKKNIWRELKKAQWMKDRQNNKGNLDNVLVASSIAVLFVGALFLFLSFIFVICHFHDKTFLVDCWVLWHVRY